MGAFVAAVQTLKGKEQRNHIVAAAGRNAAGRNVDGRNTDGRNAAGRNAAGRKADGWNTDGCQHQLSQVVVG